MSKKDILMHTSLSFLVIMVLAGFFVVQFYKMKRSNDYIPASVGILRSEPNTDN